MTSKLLPSTERRRRVPNPNASESADPVAAAAGFSEGGSYPELLEFLEGAVSTVEALTWFNQFSSYLDRCDSSGVFAPLDFPEYGDGTNRRRLRSGSSEISVRQLLQHRLVELGLGQEFLQPLVLELKLLQAFHVLALHAGVLRSPAYPGGLGDLELPEDLGQVPPFVEQPFTLADLAEGMGRAVSVTLHRLVHPPTLGSGCSQAVDRFQGDRSLMLGPFRSATRHRSAFLARPSLVCFF